MYMHNVMYKIKLVICKILSLGSYKKNLVVGAVASQIQHVFIMCEKWLILVVNSNVYT